MRLYRIGILANRARVLAALCGLSCALPLHAERLETLAPTRPAPGNERRVALVIGNGAYTSAPLRNPVNDARAIARVLTGTGFSVALVEDATLAGMRRAVREFGNEIARGGVGLFYYAGHGMQLRGRNYLIPVNADVQSEDEVEDQALDANFILAKMDSARNALNLMMLDACRNNPFARSFRSMSQGLAQMDAPSGTLISFATAPGSVAADGAGDNGVYTKHLLTAMAQPGLPVEQMFKQVRIGVARDTGEKQVPWESSSLRGDFYFLPASEQAATQQAAVTPPAAPVLQPRPAPPPAQIARVAPAPPPAPAGKPGVPSAGDRWLYRGFDVDRTENRYEVVVEVASASESGVVEVARAESGMAVPWTYTRKPALVGSSTGFVMFAPYHAAFEPLTVGQRWRDVDVERINPCGMAVQGSLVACRADARVAGKERVSVAAGTFEAFKIVVEVTFQSGIAQDSSSREMIYWYSDEARRVVKYTNRVVSAGITSGADPNADFELVAYQFAGGAPLGNAASAPGFASRAWPAGPR